MPTHAEQKKLPYRSDQLFDLVADVESYPQFLPWCLACRITRREDEHTFYADLTIGYKFVRETFVSKVHLTPHDTIHVEYLEGPLKNLSNKWRFIDNSDGSTTIDFYVDFEFKSIIIKKLMGVFFNEAVRRMVSAFETRARTLYTKGPQNSVQDHK